MPDMETDRAAAARKAKTTKVLHIIEGARPEDRLPGEYVIGPGDVLAINIWQGIKAELRRVQVNERGLVSFGYVDDVRTAGLTVQELDRILTKKLARFIKNPRIEISVTKFSSKIVRVMGAVARPRNIQIAKAITVLDTILLSGGHITNTTRGDLERIRLIRDGSPQTINLLRYISGSGGNKDNPLVQANDLIFVPEASREQTQENRVYVFGEVKRPGVYSFSYKMTALDAIAKSGGFSDFGLPGQVRIIRGDPERPQVLLADLDALLQRGDLRGNLLLESNDVIVVPRSVIGDMTEFIRQVSPILDFLFYPARLRDVYSINSNVLKFDVGGPSAGRAESQSEGTFSADAPSTNIILQ